MIKSSELFASYNINRISEASLIQNEERIARIEKAQNLLRQNKMVALVLMRVPTWNIFQEFIGILQKGLC